MRKFFIFRQMIITSTQFFNSPPQKIISLVPSQTELLSAFNLDKEVIGITKFCVHPTEWFKNKQRIGGTKNLNLSLIKKLKPDLIIANKEENVKQQIQELATEFNVWITDVNTLEDALKMINDIGELTHKITEAKTLLTEIRNNFSGLLHDNINLNIKSCYLIWKEPYMTVGGDTFINDMMKYAGLQNIFENKKRYPEISLEELSTADCQLILLSSEPYPFKQKHLKALQEQLPGKKIILVDGEMFSWYGSRLLKAPAYFTHLIKSL
jgi:ABC-type Fe3+-hydroxamate transport system substrate-binding protein